MFKLFKEAMLAVLWVGAVAHALRDALVPRKARRVNEAVLEEVDAVVANVQAEEELKIPMWINCYIIL
jgi:hypothetical protein